MKQGRNLAVTPLPLYLEDTAHNMRAAPGGVNALNLDNFTKHAVRSIAE